MNKTASLPPAIDAHCAATLGRAGPMRYYAAGEGRPLLLLHSINAAGSSREVRPLFDHFRESRRVYAPDLPGFGRSDRGERDYSVRLYVDAIEDILEVIASDAAPEPVDALGLSLSSEFLARAAKELPARFRSLALVTATGFRSGSNKLREPEGSTLERQWLSKLLSVKLWRGAIYQWLVRPPSIRYFLTRTWGSEDIDEDLAAYADLTTHQPGAENAPFAFLSGRLFSADIRDVYESLKLPVWLPHATKGDFQDFRGASWTRERTNWRVTAYDSGALPFFEHTEAFLSDYEDFLESASAFRGQLDSKT